LDILAKKVGFRVRKIIEDAHRLILYASNKEFEIMTFEEVDFRKKIYIPYLYQIVNERKTSDILYDGASWRLFKELVNMGEYEKALEIYEKTNLKNFLESESFENLINNIENIKTFDEFGSKYPYFLPSALYYLGMLLLNHIADYECSAKSFKSSFIVGLKCLSLGIAYYEEMADLLWWAKFHEGLSYLYRGNISEAIKCFGLILENFNNPNKRFFFITPSKLIIKRVIKSLEQWLGE
jgi:tetratricopeptide (TPR) repeat protein